MNLVIGDLIFLDSGSPFNKVIQMVSGFKYGHVAIYLGAGMVADIKAGQEGRLIYVEQLDIVSCEVHRLKDLSIESQKMIQEVGLAVLDKSPKYDYLSILRLFMHYKGFKTSRKSYDIEKLYCSEFIDYIYSVAGYDLMPGKTSLVGIDDLYYSAFLDKVEDALPVKKDKTKKELRGDF